MNAQTIQKAKQLVYETHRQQFDRFYELLVGYNKKFNLTAITEEKDVFLKHFVDSLAGMELFDERANCIEIGSGAGFPSLPLKLVRPDLRFTLVESVGKKCEFLRVVVDNFALEGVDIFYGRAEDAAKKREYRGKFDIATARALAPLPSLAEYCMPFLRRGGKMIAYKGETDEASQAKRAIALLGGRLVYNGAYELEGMGRRLVVTEQETLCPDSYPRGNGKVRRNPL